MEESTFVIARFSSESRQGTKACRGVGLIGSAVSIFLISQPDTDQRLCVRTVRRWCPLQVRSSDQRVTRLLCVTGTTSADDKRNKQPAYVPVPAGSGPSTSMKYSGRAQLSILGPCLYSTHVHGCEGAPNSSTGLHCICCSSGIPCWNRLRLLCHKWRTCA